MTGSLQLLTVGTAIGCGLMAGLFFAFSVCVMGALGRRPPAEGMAVMQAINLVILNPLFFIVFFGTAAGCALCVAVGSWQWSAPGAAFLVLGGAAYLGGGVLVTATVNVPLNNRLAGVRTGDPDGADRWADYRVRWTAWNHIRAAACILAMTFLILAVGQ
ncbi:MAG: anthrone oxygenase family protein [Inquilinaceae bacterium]